MTSPVSRREYLLVTLLAVLATYVFWTDLWHGGGLIGGDIYPYFMPQKQVLSESLKSGTLPFWHNRTGFGYPLIAESQTGVFYPPNWLLYGLLSEHRAYHVSQLLHYVVAFVACWRLAREWGLHFSGALIAAIVFVYGWFPPRICLEWAIVGGCYLPLALLCIERYIKARRPMSLLVLALLLGCQMTAGHFHLAFITQLTTLSYAILKLASRRTAEKCLPLRARIAKPFVAIVLAFVGAIALAAVQLGPSWELKLSSQRQTTTSRDFDPGYGHIPPLYLSQVVASWWWWHSEDINRDQALGELKFGAIASGTNQVEAHLYFGLLPLTLVVAGLLSRRTRQELLANGGWIWLLLGVAAVIYVTGWLLPITRHLPGFSFFRGLGRFGIVTTLAVGLLAGRAFEVFLQRLPNNTRTIPLCGLVLLTMIELHVVSRRVTYSLMLKEAPISYLQASVLRERFKSQPANIRLDAPGANLTNLLGVSSVPEYLGLGPIEYYAVPTQARLLDPTHEEGQTLPRAVRLTRYLDWAENVGVTHVLLYDRISTDDFEDRIKLAARGNDLFLNLAWGRDIQSPLYLYELPQSRGRTGLLDGQNGSVEIASYEANRVTLNVNATEPATVVLRDLDYPGWSVTVDGQPATAKRIAPYFRGVDVSAGKHRIEWTFQPSHFGLLASISSATFLAMIAAMFWLLRRREVTFG